jgi:hypothetical protein
MGYFTPRAHASAGRLICKPRFSRWEIEMNLIMWCWRWPFYFSVVEPGHFVYLVEHVYVM